MTRGFRAARGRLRLLGVLLLAAVAAVAAVSFFAGDALAVGSLGVRQVTPDQLAHAMQADEFYSMYREDALVVRGTVAAVSHDDTGTTVAFQTQPSFGASCRMAADSPTVAVGATITVVTVAASAERQPAQVLLASCLQP